MKKIGILHPGMMGIYVAASIAGSGYDLFWASEGRSEATKQRAESCSLTDLGLVREVCRRCQVLISVCPPHGALEMAVEVASSPFRGVYLDANAISPGVAKEIDNLFRDNVNIDFVDGGIIGRPVWEKSGTRLYLSGGKAEGVNDLFAKGILQSSVLGDEIGQASGLKMCYAAYTKGTTALLASILALSETLNVRDALEGQWDENQSGFAAASHEKICKATPKAWRFEGEMKEISKTFNEAGLPGDFHAAALEIFARLREYKNVEGLPEFAEVLQTLLSSAQTRKI